MRRDKRQGSALLRLTLSMLVFGTVGIVRRGVAFPSGFTAMARGIIGAIVILVFMLIVGRRPSGKAIRANLWLLILSGMFIGINWILLFEAFRYTTVASATLVYYMAPIFVTVASPLVLRARVGVRGWLAVGTAFVGMVLVSEPWAEGFLTAEGTVGILLALGAALFYAAVTLLNKKLHGINSLDRTLVQLAVAAITVLPYTLAAEEVTASMLDVRTLLLTLLLGVLHTGVAYLLYFGSLESLSATTVAIFGYIDPILAVLLSALLLREPMSPLAIVGAVLILSATLLPELFPERGSNE